MRKIIPDSPLSDVNGYISLHKLKGWALFTFRMRIFAGNRKAWWRLQMTLLFKRCYYGPFKGEFGHFLAHTLPFLAYLHRRGVKIHYCGMELHKPFLVDESGQSIIHEFTPLRDFFAEVAPRSNSAIPPQDVQEVIAAFNKKAKRGIAPFWNIGDDFYYWFIHRNWLLRKPYTQGYDLSKVYGGKKENNVVIFPRSKGAKFSDNNGGPWDYQQLAEKLGPYFNKVLICGHPSQVLALEAKGNIELHITADNAVILEKCANSTLIITQHSGVNNLGEFVGTQVLLIYNGEGPIGSLHNTLRFRPSLMGQKTQQRFELAYAFSDAEILDYLQKHIARI